VLQIEKTYGHLLVDAIATRTHPLAVRHRRC
jgi:hypothetical protein